MRPTPQAARAGSTMVKSAAPSRNTFFAPPTRPTTVSGSPVFARARASATVIGDDGSVASAKRSGRSDLGGAPAAGVSPPREQADPSSSTSDTSIVRDLGDIRSFLRVQGSL